MTKRKALIGVGIAVVLGGLAWANLGITRETATEVTVEAIEGRDLASVVSASGKVQPKSSVDISAETMGKVVSVMVEEGDLVARGQLLLQIDPKNLETQVQNREASLASAKSQNEQTRAQIENTRVALREAEIALERQRDLFKQGLIAREIFERAENEVQRQRTNLNVSEQSVKTQEQRIKQEEANLESARYDLNKVRVVSPIAGIVTRRNIDEGETAVVGTMNNAGTVLLTIADLSIIETEIEVDETEIPSIRIGQPAEVTIDAIPDRTFAGKVTEVGNSPIATGSQAAGRATNFKVVVTIDGRVDGVRPGFTCTAKITTATRTNATAVPIQAMTVREFEVDAEGHLVKPPAPEPGQRPEARPRPSAATAALPKGHERKEIEGVFVMKDGRAEFVPVKTGIDGEKYFEVLDGLKVGDRVITGPFQSVRAMREGDAVKADTGPSAASPPAKR
jgi:HlyD family secretion protein